MTTQLAGPFDTRAVGLGDPAVQAAGVLADFVSREAYVLAYIDAFWLIAWVSLLGILLILLLRPAPPKLLIPSREGHEFGRFWFGDGIPDWYEKTFRDAHSTRETTRQEGQAVPAVEKGSTRWRLPVAAKTALATAGPIGATPGSPTPVGASVEGTIWTSTFGMSSMRRTW